MLKRLFIVRPDRLGDVVVSSAVLSPLYQRYSAEYQITWCVQRQYLPLFQNIQKFLPNLNLLSIEDLAENLQSIFEEQEKKEKNKNFSVKVIFLNPDKKLEKKLEKEIRSHHKNLPAEIFTWGRTLRDTRKLCEKPEALYAADLLSASGFPISAVELPFVTIAKTGEIVEFSPKVSLPPCSYVVFHVAAHHDKPTIPLKTFIELSKLSRAGGLQVVWVGLDRHRRESDAFLHAAKSHDIILANIPSVEVLSQWLISAKGVIGRDSGVAHLAAALGIPTVALVGPLGKTPALKRWRVMGKITDSFELPISKNFAPKWYQSDRAYQRRYFACASAEELWQRLKSLMEK